MGLEDIEKSMDVVSDFLTNLCERIKELEKKVERLENGYN